MHGALTLKPAKYLIHSITGVVDAMNPPTDLSEPDLVSFEAPKLIGDANGYCPCVANYMFISPFLHSSLVILIRVAYTVLLPLTQILLGSG